MRHLFPVTLPVWPVDDDGHCTCYLGAGCRRPGKHADERAPEDSPAYAVVTGQAGGVIVVDQDRKPNSPDGVAQFIELSGGDLPTTFETETPTTGRHTFYLHPGFEVGNSKPDSAIDIRADGELVYVVGPGSVGYLKTEDPCRVVPGPAYRVLTNAPIAKAPEWLLAWFRIGGTRTDGFVPVAIDETHEHWESRVQKAIDACKTMPPSQADGQGGLRLFNVCLKLVRTLELPTDKAHELIAEHFNPRCTNTDGSHFPWSDEEIQHKIEDARTKSDLPCGLAEGVSDKLLEKVRKPGATPRPPVVEVVGKKVKVGAGDTYDGEREKLSHAAVADMLYRWPDWEGSLWYDVLKRRPFVVDPPIIGKMTLEKGELSRSDLAAISFWFDVKGFTVSKDQVEDALWNVVRRPERQCNAIANYLDGLPEVTEVKHLTTLATDVLGCTDPFANALVLKTLVAAARRARDPGHRHRAMLVLKGPQYCGKTAFVKILAGDFYHSTGNGNLADRDTILECQGHMLVEVEELSALNKADANALKTAISREVDVITKKYERDGQSYPRSFVLVGTTNKDEFLTDSTGNTRYWVVEVGKVDIPALLELRDTLWAEADFLARTTAADSNELKEEDDCLSLEKMNEAFLSVHPWEDEIAKFVAGKSELRSANDVLAHIFKGDMTRADKRAKDEVADVLRSLGCTYSRRRDGGRVIRYWKVPDELAKGKSPPKVALLRPNP